MHRLYWVPSIARPGMVLWFKDETEAHRLADNSIPKSFVRMQLVQRMPVMGQSTFTTTQDWPDAAAFLAGRPRPQKGIS